MTFGEVGARLLRGVKELESKQFDRKPEFMEMGSPDVSGLDGDM